MIQYESLQQYTGMPSTDELSDKFVLIASSVREPNQKNRLTGIMCWWLRDSTGLDQPPGVYQLLYVAEDYKTEQVIEVQK